MSKPLALEIKGSMISTLDIKIYSDAISEIDAFLTQKFGERAAFFDGKTAILDLNVVPELTDINTLVTLIRRFGIIPIGLRHANEQQHHMAHRLCLASIEAKNGNSGVEPASVQAPIKQDDHLKKAVLPASQLDPDESASVIQEMLPFDQITLLETQSNPVTKNDLITHRPAMVLAKPLRSGQQCYARHADLIVLAPVSFGAEVIADGNIHIYSTLRGRALAGVLGNRDARIYCLSMKAELVSIAGVYRTFENPLPDTLTQEPVQILLNDTDQILVERIDKP